MGTLRFEPNINLIDLRECSTFKLRFIISLHMAARQLLYTDGMVLYYFTEI